MELVYTVPSTEPIMRKVWSATMALDPATMRRADSGERAITAPMSPKSGAASAASSASASWSSPAPASVSASSSSAAAASSGDSSKNESKRPSTITANGVAPTGPSGVNAGSPVSLRRGITSVEVERHAAGELVSSGVTVRPAFTSASTSTGDPHGTVTCGSSAMAAMSELSPASRTSTKYG